MGDRMCIKAMVVKFSDKSFLFFKERKLSNTIVPLRA